LSGGTFVATKHPLATMAVYGAVGAAGDKGSSVLKSKFLTTDEEKVKVKESEELK